MGDRSPHFSTFEFACHGKSCCSKSAPMALRTIEGLEILRGLLNERFPRPGNKEHGIAILCGFRCRTHNDYLVANKLGAAPNSRHVFADAVDTHCPTAALDDYLDCVLDSPFAKGGIGIYHNRAGRVHPWMVHLDLRGYVARWPEACWNSPDAHVRGLQYL